MPGATPDGSVRSQKRQIRLVDRDSERRRDRTGTGLGPSESRHHNQSFSAPVPAVRSNGVHAWSCAATADPQTSRRRLDLNMTSATYFDCWPFRQLKTLNAAFCPSFGTIYLSTGYAMLQCPPNIMRKVIFSGR